MTLAQFIAQYGYGAVFVGTLLEGETILLLAGIAAHKGYLSFPLVVAVAVAGGALGDQILFAVGRRYGRALLRRYPRLEVRAAPVGRLIERHQSALIVGVRFLYGMRLVGPFAIGMSGVSRSRFLVLNLLGAAIWAPLFIGLGKVFGHTIGWLLADLGRYEWVASLALVAVLAIAAGVHRWWKARRPPPA